MGLALLKVLRARLNDMLNFWGETGEVVWEDAGKAVRLMLGTVPRADSWCDKAADRLQQPMKDLCEASPFDTAPSNSELIEIKALMPSEYG